MELTYSHVGATRDDKLPDGYRRLKAKARVGRGERVYAAAVHALGSFDMQRAAGLRVRTDAGMATVGARVEFGFGLGPARLWAPVQVVWVVNEPLHYGYGYGTLPGHPESGEESFVVTLGEEDQVLFTVRAFTRPGTLLARVAGPVGRIAQRLVAERYVRAMRRLAAG